MVRKTCAARRFTYSALLSLVVLMEKGRRFKMFSLAITSLLHLARTRFNNPTAWLREIPSIYKLRVSLGSSRSRGFSKLTRRRLYGSIKTEVYASHVSR